MVADKLQLPRWEEPRVDILRLASNWLYDEENGRWIMVLDNADNPTVFSDPCKAESISDNRGLVIAVPLSTFLPQTSNGSILTSCSQNAALRLIGSDEHIIHVKQRTKAALSNSLKGSFEVKSIKMM